MKLNEPVAMAAPSRATMATFKREAGFHAAFAVAVIAICAYLAWRNHGLFPAVFADEWLYSQFARLQPLSASTLPSYLYLKLYGATSACGAGFLDCARLFNSILFAASAPFIYLTARPVTGRGAALVIAVTSLLAPVNSYTAYFMPESPYYLCFWIVSWFLLSGRASHSLRGAMLAGGMVGVMALVKVHALFLLPAFCLFVLWQGWRRGDGARDGLRVGLQSAVALAVSALAVKTVLGWLLAGPNGLSLFGSFYGNHAHNSGGGHLARLLAPALVNLKGHLAALVLLFAVPLVAFGCAAASTATRRELGHPGRGLLLYTILTLGAALGMTVAYTASIADAGPLEGLRLHLRYYDFTFPLLAMVAASPALAFRSALTLRAGVVLACAALLLYAMFAIIPDYSLSFVDGPEIFGLANPLPDDALPWPHRLRTWLPTLSHDMRLFTVIMQAFALGVWLWRPQWARRVFVWLLLPGFALSASLVSDNLLDNAREANVFDRAGRFVAQALTPQQRGQLALAGDSQAGLTRMQFHADSATASTIELAPDAPFALSQLPARKQFLLVVGKHALPPEIKAETVTPDYALVRIDSASRSLYRIDFSQPFEGGPLASAQGMDGAEGWGRWSNSKQVVLTFAQPLPRRLALFLNAHAYGPNVGQDFVLAVDGVERRFKLLGSAQEQYFGIDTDGRQRSVTITVPAPSAPPGGDLRKLGIGIASVEIGER